MINNVVDEHGFRQYDFYLNNPNTKLTIEEFDRDNEIFVEVEPKLLWAELDKKSVYGKAPFFLMKCSHYLVITGEGAIQHQLQMKCMV